MFPYPSRLSQPVVIPHGKIRATLQNVATFRQSEQPRHHGHIHPHGHATARLSRSFAATLSRDEAVRGGKLDEIELGAHLHDIGKYLIPESILLKPGPLTAAERATVAFHPAFGAYILSGLPGVTETVYRIVLCHHERWDGGGYPEGLSGSRIPFAARLVAVCDVYTSLRARRTYKHSLSRREAVAAMEEMAGRELDPDMVQDFFRYIQPGQRRHRGNDRGDAGLRSI
ncbi:MAG: HD domain-containing protein [Acidobacteria bacterium]|nr:HD domain-containing protein [Acidobacteriota bacterium]MCA1642916.1 HD domain-containing protein [Acidobacteriota bacterium]